MTGQRLMQATSDIFLGWVHVKSGIDGAARDFYGRQLRDWKGSVEVKRQNPSTLGAYGRLCGWTLARAHARSGDRIAIASYLGGGKPSIARSSGSRRRTRTRTSSTTLASRPPSRTADRGADGSVSRPADRCRRVSQGPAVTWLGHATVLIELDGVRLITDPVLGARVGFLLRAGGAVDPASMRDLDAVLLSHLHADHAHVASLRPSGRACACSLPRARGGGWRAGASPTCTS